MMSGAKTAPAWNQWEGRIIDGKFPLLRYLGATEHSAVFLTERPEGEPRRTAIKLLPADDITAEALLARWKASAPLSHPDLLRLFEMGRGSLGEVAFAYVLMEYAEEDLSQVDRPLTGCGGGRHAGGGLESPRLSPRQTTRSRPSEALEHIGGRRSAQDFKRHDPAGRRMAQRSGCAGAVRPAGDRAARGLARGRRMVAGRHAGGSVDEAAAFMGWERGRGVLARQLAPPVCVHLSRTAYASTLANAGRSPTLENRFSERPQRPCARGMNRPPQALRSDAISWRRALLGWYLRLPPLCLASPAIARPRCYPPPNRNSRNRLRRQIRRALRAVQAKAAAPDSSGIIARVLPDVPAKARNTIRGKVTINIRVGIDANGSRG